MVRIDAPLFFANIIPIKDTLTKYEERAEAHAAATGKKLLFLILDLSPVTDVDASSVHYLKDLIMEQERKGVKLALANPSRFVTHQIERAGLDKLIGREWIFVRMHQAVSSCKELLAEAQGSRPALHINPEMKAALSRATNEPHVGGVLGEGVLGLNTSSAEQQASRKSLASASDESAESSRIPAPTSRAGRRWQGFVNFTKGIFHRPPFEVHRSDP
eukprot:jgi/Botrbrau1/17585/Bobra.0166s0027.1